MEQRDITSMGDVNLEKGEYGNISCAGDLKISGAIKALSIKSAGDMKAQEDVKVDKLTVFGDATFRKNLKATEISVYGDGDFQGKLTGQAVKIYGSLTAGTIEAEEITVNGELEKAQEVSAEKIILNGEFHVEGAMNIGHGIFNLGGDSKVKEIFCEVLEVNVGNNSYQGMLAGLISRGKGGTLKVELIEGDEIHLQNTRADIVRGKTVRIGAGSKIGKVEYSDTLEIFDGGIVENKEEF